MSNMASGNKIRSSGRVPNSPCWIVFISSIQIRTHGKREHRLRNFLSQIGAFFFILLIDEVGSSPPELVDLGCIKECELV